MFFKPQLQEDPGRAASFKQCNYAGMIQRPAEQERQAAAGYAQRAAEGYERAAVFAVQEAIALAAVALEKANILLFHSSGVIRQGLQHGSI